MLLDIAAALLALGTGAALIAAPAAAMAPAMLPATALVAAAAFERLPAALLGLGHAAAFAAFAAMVAAASAPTAPEILVAVAPAGLEIALRSRAGRRGRLAQAQQPLQAAKEAERLFDRCRSGLRWTEVVARALHFAAE